ncbi:error-prone DNA polymerase [Allonocardiopsis opalescens]|uniref:Error-prone DNA polymerase n=1 Tax=Allonocardiopsis opalescens TaxID=1144618 RepID=A0A2T0QEJ6_9ACTN|nr:error-prone DNA polymerase [Allonocardiopsis opalescens]PRY02281.1 DnaE-like error-prone DNA polymerase [Allonocardiopsis opalescens]
MGWDNPPIHWKEFERRLSWGRPRPDGAGDGGGAGRRPRRALRVVPDPPEPRGDAAPVPWAELHCHSSYSFLDGASAPEELVAEALRLGVGTLALTDHDGMYGVVRFAEAARGTGLRTAFGAELSLDRPAPREPVPDPGGRHLLVLARDPDGYAALSAEISRAQLAGAKGRPVYRLDGLAAAHGGRWAVLTGCRKGAVPAALRAHGPRAARRELDALVDRFGRENVLVELVDQGRPEDDARNDALFALARAARVGAVASGNVHQAAPSGTRLAHALAAVRARRSLDEMAGWLPAAGSHLRGGAEMAARLARYPGVFEATVELGESCAFDLRLIAPSLPDCPVEEGHDEASWLRELVERRAPARYGPRGAETTPGAYAQIDRELDVIEAGEYPGYFLIVHDIVEFCRSRGILCQGRGSAANSAVCYALGITNVDAVSYGLLFERFLSPIRDGPPDIDLDIENRRREEVIQYVYERYGRDRAAQVANVISYRPRLAVRDAARALGFSPGQQDAWSRHLEARDPVDADRAAEAGIPPRVAELAERMQRLPRHLGIHSGGMVICDRPVGEVCPVEWASMPGRSVLQWDKDDCAAIGLVKFDLLGLGMLSALHDAFDLVADHHGVRYDLAGLPGGDPLVYAMLCEADSVGVFQVESRAQMGTLPRLRPEKFYDLVIEVALIRPGPIQGGSVHPYLRRRQGREAADCPHPLMENALRRTLGVPLFQEQMMQLAVDCAGFTPAEADRLRQAMSSKRAPERVHELRERLLAGMAERGIGPEVAEDVYDKILGFASFGFPESHAISFAHLVYASAWLKRHYPAAFTAALLRNQPMGFYHPRTLLDDARRHGVRVLGVDLNASGVSPGLEKAEADDGDTGGGPPHPHAPALPQPAIRLGLADVRGLGAEAAEAIAAGQPYTDPHDLAMRVRLPAASLEALATAGAFGCFGLSRREALWAARSLAAVRPGQLPGTTPGTEAPALPAMSPAEETYADLWATGSSRVHPLAHVRGALDRRGALPAARLRGTPDGSWVRIGGLVTHRQRPETAGGMTFLNVEDETGMANVVCPPPVWRRHRVVARTAPAVVVHGRLERRDGVVNVLAAAFEPLAVPAVHRSRDFQ